MKKILFFFESSKKIGGGHAYRCLALANIFFNLNWEINIASVEETRIHFPEINRYKFLIFNFNKDNYIDLFLKNIDFISKNISIFLF